HPLAPHRAPEPADPERPTRQRIRRRRIRPTRAPEAPKSPSGATKRIASRSQAAARQAIFRTGRRFSAARPGHSREDRLPVRKIACLGDGYTRQPKVSPGKSLVTARQALLAAHPPDLFHRKPI